MKVQNLSGRKASAALRDQLYWLIPALLAVGLMLPRLASAQFGFFDDALTLRRSSQVQSGEWWVIVDIYGRSRPLYWLWYILLDLLSGRQPAGFFIGNVVLLLTVTLALIRLVRALGAGRLQAGLAGILFVLAEPVLENMYTLSKAELLQAALILPGLLAAGRAGVRANGWRPNGWTWLAAGCFFLAAETKETTILLLPIGVAWLVLGWFAGKWLYADDEAGRRALLLVRWQVLQAVLLGLGAYLGASALYLSLGELSEGYGGSGFIFNLTHIKENGRIWLNWLRRDYLYLVPLALLPGIEILLRRNWRRFHLYLEIAIWCIPWLGIYLPWIFTPEYYLLPFALGAALFGADLVVAHIHLWQTRRWYWRAAVAAGLLSAGVLFVFTLPNYLTNARLQLVQDAANQAMLDYTARELPPNSVLLINMQRPSEYLDRIEPMLQEVSGRWDIQVSPTDLDEHPAQSWPGHQVYVALPTMENQFYPTVRMAVSESQSRGWNKTLLAYLPEGAEPIFTVREYFPIFNVDLRYWYCPFTPTWGVCDVPAAPFDRRRFGYGWDVYSVEP